MHQKFINHALGDHGLPGVFFMFDISPILVQLSEQRRSFLHFLTGVCAIVGGVFTGLCEDIGFFSGTLLTTLTSCATVAGIIDSVVYNGLRSWQKKQQLGKAG
jgi:hypothetical protein